MMRRGLVVAAVAVAVVIGVAAAALPAAQGYLASALKSQMEKDGSLAVASVEVGLLDRRITLGDLKSKQLNGISARRWEVTGLSWPLDEILKGRTPLSGYRLGDPLQAARLEVDDMRMSTADGQSWSFGSVVMEDVNLRRFDPNVPAGLFQGALTIAHVLQALSIGRMEERDVLYKIPLTGNTMGFRRLTVEKFDRGQLGSFSLETMEASAKDGTEPGLSLATLEGRKLDLRTALAAMTAPGWQPGMPTGRVTMDHALANGFGGEVFTRYGITLGSIAFDHDRTDADAVRSSLRVDGFVMTPPARGVEGLQLRMGLAAMDLKDVKLAFECKGTERRSKSEMTIDRCALTGPDLGELNLTGKLVDADAAFWKAMETGDMASLVGSKVALGEAKLVFADKSLLQRSIALLGLSTGQSAAQARAGLAEEVKRYQPPNVLITDDMTKLLETVSRFVEKGGTLTLDAKPDPPFGLDKVRYLQQPGPDLLSLLGLTAKLSP